MIKGDKFEETFIATEDIYQGFIAIFRDKNPLHTNKTFAVSKGFRDKVVHGNVLGGFISYFIGECLPEKNVIIHSQEINYINPVHINDKLTFKAEINDVFESVNVIVFKFMFEKENIKIAKGKIQIGII